MVNRSNYFRGEPIRRTKVEMRMERLQIRMRSLEKWKRVKVTWIWRLCNMAFEDMLSVLGKIYAGI